MTFIASWVWSSVSITTTFGRPWLAEAPVPAPSASPPPPATAHAAIEAQQAAAARRLVRRCLAFSCSENPAIGSTAGANLACDRHPSSVEHGDPDPDRGTPVDIGERPLERRAAVSAQRLAVQIEVGGHDAAHAQSLDPGPDRVIGAGPTAPVGLPVGELQVHLRAQPAALSLAALELFEP